METFIEWQEERKNEPEERGEISRFINDVCGGDMDLFLSEANPVLAQAFLDAFRKRHPESPSAFDDHIEASMCLHSSSLPAKSLVNLVRLAGCKKNEQHPTALALSQYIAYEDDMENAIETARHLACCDSCYDKVFTSGLAEVALKAQIMMSNKKTRPSK